MGHLSCIISPASCIIKSIAKSTLGGFFNTLTSWVLDSVHWFFSATGSVLTSASEPSTVVRASSQEFAVLLKLAPAILLLGLLVSTLHALQRGEGSSLWRLYFGVAPACVAAIALARPMASLVLEAVNQLSSTAATTVTQHEAALTKAMTELTITTPGFGLFLLGLTVVVGTWLLWCELIVRTVVLTLLLVLVPVIVPLSVLPSGRRLGWRLAETFLAVAASKLLIVITLSLGLNELMGSSATQIITGAVTLLLATASPFLLLRVIPFIEQSALHNLEGVRSRYTRLVTGASSSPLATVARNLVPEMPVPGPTPRPDDLGLEMWRGSGETPMPPMDGERPPPPIGEPRARGGHVAYYKDDMGPVVGWHFDE